MHLRRVWVGSSCFLQIGAKLDCAPLVYVCCFGHRRRCARFMLSREKFELT